MGCYDVVEVLCPKCGQEHWLQSKGGPCFLHHYPLKACPEDILSDVNRHSPTHCACGAVFEVDIPSRKAVLLDPPQEE